MSSKQEKEKFRIGFDLGGTKMLATVLDSKYNIVGSAKTESRGYEGEEKGIARMARLTRQALRNSGVRINQLESAGFAVPGVVDMDKGVLVEATNLGWSNLPIRTAMEKILKVPVAVLNDVDSGTYGEYHKGAGRGCRTLLGIFPGTGIGGGCVYDGHILRGKKFSCMEIGNIKVPTPSGLVRMEDLTSRLAIAIQVAREAYRGNAPSVLEKAGTDVRKIKSGTIAKSMKVEPDVKIIVDEAIEVLGYVTAGVVDLIGPDKIVLGGGLVEKMKQDFIKGITKSISMHTHKGIKKGVKVVGAELGDDAVVVGAAIFSSEKI